MRYNVKKILLITILLGVLIVGSSIIFYGPNNFKKIRVSGITIVVELADTFPRQMKGLMFRENLPDNMGMLFIFDNDDFHSVWMMNMMISLDVIWLDSETKVVDIARNIQPCQGYCSEHKPSEKSRYFLEINSGFADKYGIKIGDQVQIID